MHTEYIKSQQCLEIAFGFLMGLLAESVALDDALTRTAYRFSCDRAKLAALWFDYAEGRTELCLEHN